MPRFKKLQRWRAGEEAQISYLKRKHGIGRSLSRRLNGTKTWVGLGIRAYNLRQIACLTWLNEVDQLIAKRT
jgi:hypothetical protein